MFNMEPIELLLVMSVLVVVPATVAFGLYWIIRKAVADARREPADNDIS